MSFEPRLIMVTILIILLTVFGCTAHAGILVEFNDTGDVVQNKLVCYNLTKNACYSRFDCVGFTPGDVICSKDKCIC
jgi:hypothetical protein